jgi:hypothetical protein
MTIENSLLHAKVIFSYCVQVWFLEILLWCTLESVQAFV